MQALLEEQNERKEVIEAFDPLSSIEYSDQSPAEPGSFTECVPIYDFPPPPPETETSLPEPPSEQNWSGSVSGSRPTLSSAETGTLDMKLFLEKVSQIETHLQRLTEENEKLNSEQGFVSYNI